MSQNLRMHRVFPTNKRVSIGENENIDFELSFPNRKLICNSLRIEGKILVYSTGNTRTVMTNDIFVDNLVGAHSFIETYETSSSNKGVVEYFSNAPRYHKMVVSGSNTVEDMANLSNTCELKSQSLQLSRNVFFGNVNADQAIPNPNTSDAQSFSMKPMFILNQVQRGVANGSVNLDFETMGDIRISCRTAKNNDALFGTDSDNNVRYELSEISLCFHSVPSDGKQDPLVMRTKQCVRQSVQSSNGTVSVNVPMLSNGCSISMIRQSQLNSNRYNTLKLDRPPNVSQVQFLINDSPSDFLAYQLRSENEILKHYLDSISNSDLNDFSQSKIKANEAYGLGINFMSLLDLSRDRFGVNVQSAIAEPYLLYLFFHGVVQV
jgi:hypothetical protein